MAAFNRLNDVEIVNLVIRGNVNAFEILLKRYKPYVAGIVKKHVPFSEVGDVSQDVFIRAYQSLRTCKGKDNFKQWLFTISVRTCHDFWRKHYKSHEYPMSALTPKHQEWMENIIANESCHVFNRQTFQNEAREVLDWALDRLSAGDRMIIELVYLEGFSGQEAAKLLNWSIGKVKMRLFRSRKKLKKLLSDFYGSSKEGL